MSVSGVAEGKKTYPYISSRVWFTLREKLRQSKPRSINADWLMSALDVSEKGAGNVLPQVRALGLVDDKGAPSSIAEDLRHDDSYATACREIIERVYDETLQDAHNDPAADPTKVAVWFMRNAGTGSATAKVQAKFYLLLLGGELPSEDEKKKVKAAAPRAAKTVAKKVSSSQPAQNVRPKQDDTSPANPQKPTLHIDLQIHIAADATEAHIDAVFRSMATHLYGA